ncbi:MAG: hypothetical protein AAB443_02260 [Patescibacteria group bacterium]
MTKIKVRVLALILTLVLLIGSFIGVSFAEKNKKMQKELERAAKLSWEQDLAKQEFEAEKNKIKLEYSKLMAEAKTQYEQILREQPGKVKEHTRSIASSTTPSKPSTAQVQTKKSSAPVKTSSAVSIKTSKPKVTKSTKAS